MKKAVIIILILSLCLSLCACGASAPEPVKSFSDNPDAISAASESVVMISVYNSNNDLIARITEKQDDKETVELLIAQVYDMALMNLRPLTPEETQEFSRRSIEIMTKIL